MKKQNPFRYFKTFPKIIRQAEMMYVRLPLSLRNVEDLLHGRSIDISYESERYWWNRFGPKFSAEIKRQRTNRLKSYSNWQWHVDEVLVKINGERQYQWRALDNDGEMLEAYVSKRREKKAALKFLKKAMRKYGKPEAIVTDRYPARSTAEM